MPFSLVYGMEAVIPVEVGLSSAKVNTFAYGDNEGLQQEALDLVDELQDQAMVRVAAYKQRMRAAHDQTVKARQFQVGDLVWRQADALKHVGKLQPNWEGPYKPDLDLSHIQHWSPPGGVNRLRLISVPAHWVWKAGDHGSLFDRASKAGSLDLGQAAGYPLVKIPETDGDKLAEVVGGVVIILQKLDSVVLQEAGPVHLRDEGGLAVLASLGNPLVHGQLEGPQLGILCGEMGLQSGRLGLQTVCFLLFLLAIERLPYAGQLGPSVVQVVLKSFNLGRALNLLVQNEGKTSQSLVD
ncbi:pol polyprotein [Striga asiatica]|uniref:Pol polyprotein n=1 Tax=Striga asiatica TaxID=4170 RepID=A0A5A7PKV5_STRAF|nr:pol polyprotein [Striga asiatica]